jgi:hypothetical protein
VSSAPRLQRTADILDLPGGFHDHHDVGPHHGDTDDDGVGDDDDGDGHDEHNDLHDAA